MNLTANGNLFMRLIYIFILLFIIPININLQAQWVQANGPAGGNVSAIVWDESRIYVGLSNGGVHISSDNGVSWTRSNIGLPVTLQVRAMLVKDQYVFVGLINHQVYASSNQGQTWYEANNGLPNLTVRVFAKADSFIFLGSGSSGIFRSSDYGANWYLSSSGLTNGNIKAFASLDSIIFTGTEDGIFISTNYGNNWIERSNGLTDKYINDLTNLNNNIAAATQDGVFISTDDGENWQPAGFQGSNLLSLTAVDSILIAGTFSSGIYYSSDYGSNWYQFNDEYPPNAITNVLETKGDQILAGNSLGIYGVQLSNPPWIDMNNGIYGTTSYCFAVKDSVLVAGTYSGGVFISYDLGDTWISRRIIYGYNGPKELEFKGDSLYALCFGGLFVSDDLGLNWDELYIPAQYFTALAVKENNIFVGTDQVGIWRSTDSGLSWSQINSGLTNLFVKAIAVDDSNVYCGTNEGLFISSDNGENWGLAGPGISQTISVETIKMIDNYIYVGAIYGIYLSTNGGAYWSYKGFNYDIVECIEGYGDVVFAGILDPWDGGVFVSTNKGGTWQQFNSGLPYLDPFSLAIVDTTLFAGIAGHSVWRTSTIVTDVPAPRNILPARYVLSQNYPNPFNPATTIEYQIPEQSFVTIRVYDIIGNEITTLINDEKQAGSYDVSFVATGLPSGIYFYQLMSGSFVQTKKMLLIK